MRLGDRRQVTRFEIEGSVWGALEHAEPLRVHNIGRGGLLVESRLAPAVGSVLKVRLTHGFAVSEARAAVRRLEPIAKGDRCLLALEFVALDDEARALLEQMLRPADASEV
jgi:hypothetical protein